MNIYMYTYIFTHIHVYIYEQEALILAKLAEEEGEVPVGALVVSADGHVVGRGRNR